jgi:membrane protease YdiL (CAAX protease family)
VTSLSPLQLLLVLLALVLLLALAVAVCVWVFLPALRGPDVARRWLGTHRLAFGSLVVVFILSSILTAPLTPLLGPDRALTTGTFLAFALATDAPMFLVVYLRAIAPGALSWRELGLRPLPIARIVGVGVATGALAILLVAGIEMLLNEVGLRSNQIEQYSFLRQEQLPLFLLVLIVATVVAPVVEELFFRGYLFGLYLRRQPRWVAYLVPALLFALIHVMPGLMNLQQGLALAIGIFGLALLLEWTYDRTGSLLPGMLAHGLNNAVGLIAFYVLREG